MPLSPMCPPQERRAEDYRAPSELRLSIIGALFFSGIVVVSLVFSRSLKHAWPWLLLAVMDWTEVILIKAALPKAVRIATRVGSAAVAFGVWWFFTP
jgi:hypothetical protein